MSEQALREALEQLVESCMTDADTCSICLQDLTKHASGCPVVAGRASMDAKQFSRMEYHGKTWVSLEQVADALAAEAERVNFAWWQELIAIDVIAATPKAAKQHVMDMQKIACEAVVERCAQVAREQQALGASDIGFEVQQVRHEFSEGRESVLDRVRREFAEEVCNRLNMEALKADIRALADQPRQQVSGATSVAKRGDGK